jgi:hypothetical protein
MDRLVADSHELGDELLGFVSNTVTTLATTHFPGWRIPGTFAGHRVAADVRADLLYTLTHLAYGGISEIVRVPVDDVLRALLIGVDGRNTHTFFSYRVAETLLRRGPFADNPLLSSCDPGQRDDVARATDSRDWIELLDTDLLPRNYAAVLSRCELAREKLGLTDDPAVLDRLVDRLTALLGQNLRGYLDDSNDGSGRYDIYAADIWLFCEPLAPRLGELWIRGARTALALVDTVAGPDGAAIPWGRSTGVLATALTVELAALALHPDLPDDRTDAWIRRGVDAFRATRKRFDADGVIDAHRHRNQDAYRGPARRLQLTLDVLGKLAWAGATLRATTPVSLASPRDTYRAGSTLVAFEADRNAAAWVSANPARRVVVPFVGATRSHYFPVPHAPGTFEAPVDNDQVVWAPLILDHGRRATTAHLPADLTTTPTEVIARWDQLAVCGLGRDGVTPEPLVGSCTSTTSVDRRTIVVQHDLTLEHVPDAIAMLIPETARAPLHVELTADAPHATTRVNVDGLAEWATPYSGLARVHQLDVDPGHRVRMTARVTPRLRVASTAHGHWYDGLLYAPITDRVIEMPSPIGVLADADTDLDDIELLHLHWPEWFGFDDLAAHERLIATLADRGIPIVWTAHNLTPHDRRPEIYDPIYQRWANAADAVIHHSSYGRDRMLARYRFRDDCRHETIMHGHFGDLWPQAQTMTRADAEHRLGFTPTGIRIGLVGAPRADKKVVEFLNGFAACARDDVQVACWSLRIDETAPADPRIVAADRYRGVDNTMYATRLAACDVLAFPFDPDGDMLATGTLADAIGIGIPALVSDWPYLTEMLGAAGISCGHTASTITTALEALTKEQVGAAAIAMDALRSGFDWEPLATRTADLFERVVLDEP